MTTEINLAGITATAPTTATEIAETNVNAGPAKPKVMVLAVFKDEAGALVITPIDVEHETDDQRDLTDLEATMRKELRETCIANDAPMKKALAALYGIFTQRLYRAQFRSFENYCFALFGMHRIPAEIVTKAKARVKKLKAELEATI